MTRTIVGGLVGGFLIFFIGFIFWGTPLSTIPFANIDDAHGAAVQTALAQNLTESGTGTYVIPSAGTAQGTILYGQGPVATIHFNTSGFPVMDSGSLLGGFLLALVVGIVIAFALRAASGAGTGFAERGKVAVLFALAATIWLDLGQPVFNHYGWTYWIYSFVSDFVALAVCGLVIARWFLPREEASSIRTNSEA
jgi:hypothetical protein